MENCFYCEKAKKLNSLMIEICKLEASTVYLNRDQKHIGRVIVALNEHKDEYYELEDKQRDQFFKEVSLTAHAMKNAFDTDKINYATFGDKVSHVHVHLVPKHIDGLQWGLPFVDIGVEKTLLPEEEYQPIIDKLNENIKKLL